MVERLLLVVGSVSLLAATAPSIRLNRVSNLLSALAPMFVVAGLLRPLVAVAAPAPPIERLTDPDYSGTQEPGSASAEGEPEVGDAGDGSSSESPPGSAGTYRVKPGDSLWAIACRQLGSAATDSEIDRRWRSIYAQNRNVIGSNPNLIFPGQILDLHEAPRA